MTTPTHPCQKSRDTETYLDVVFYNLENPSTGVKERTALVNGVRATVAETSFIRVWDIEGRTVYTCQIVDEDESGYKLNVRLKLGPVDPVNTDLGMFWYVFAFLCMDSKVFVGDALMDYWAVLGIPVNYEALKPTEYFLMGLLKMLDQMVSSGIIVGRLGQVHFYKLSGRKNRWFLSCNYGYRIYTTD